MEKSIITVSRQFGSGGHEIGKRLADALGYKFFDNEIINMSAGASGLPRELFKSSEEAKTGTAGGFLAECNRLNNDKIFAIQADVIKQIATRGNCVVVGRCADYLLESWGAFDIFVHAQIKDRVERVRRLYPAWDDRIEDHIKRIDECRAEYYSHFTNRAWGQASNYCLSLDSSRFGVDGCVKHLKFIIEN